MTDRKNEKELEVEIEFGDDFDPFFPDPFMMGHPFDPFGMDHLEVEPPDFPHIAGEEFQEVPVDRVKEMVTENIKQIFDPEIPVNIWDLGLIYKVEVTESRHVHIEMTLTSPNCPSAQELPEWVNRGASICPGVQSSDVEIVWEPQWGKEMMSEEAQLILGLI